MYAYLVGSRVKWVAFTLAQCGANFDSRTPTTLMRCGQRQTVATIFTTFNQCFIHPGKISKALLTINWALALKVIFNSRFRI